MRNKGKVIMKFGNFKVDTNRESKRMRNYGDDLQIHAIENLYHYMGIEYSDVVRITVQELFTYEGEYLILPINYPLYGVYNHISPKIIPVYLGISLLSSCMNDSLKLKQYEPIGCRDYHTLQILRKSGIDSYLNGCMTLALPKLENYNKEGKVFIVDACEELMQCMPDHIKEEAIFQTHLVYHTFASEEDSMTIYERYKKEARLVITSRLHCAVPCLAYGIPVIYACKSISFRSVWLQNILPLYDINSFDKIDWNPQPIDIEDIKSRMLNNAATRVKNVYEKYKECLEISEIFEDNALAIEYEYESLRNAKHYIQNNWEKDKYIEYIIWGITQTSEILYDYISENFPNAKLIGVIDLYRRTNFHGVDSSDLAMLEKTNATVFVAVEAANVMAVSTFEKLNYNNYVLCWVKQDYILPIK